MELKFERKYYLRTSDYDSRLKLSPAAILDLFQDAAGTHAEELGIGFEAMLARKLIWVVARIRFRVLADPTLHEQVCVRTWPLPPSRAGFRREYIIEGSDGRTLVAGSSEWVLVHSEKRCMMPARDVYPEGQFCTDQNFEGRISRIRDFEPDEGGFIVRPGFSALDMNGHVNNTKYANYVMDALDLADSEIIDSFQIDYHREVQRGSSLSISTLRREGEIIAKGINEGGETAFACRINLK